MNQNSTYLKGKQHFHHIYSDIHNVLTKKGPKLRFHSIFNTQSQKKIQISKHLINRENKCGYKLLRTQL